MTSTYNFDKFNDIYFIYDNTTDRCVNFFDSNQILIDDISSGLKLNPDFDKATIIEQEACLPTDKYCGGNMCHVTFDHLVRAIEFNDDIDKYFYSTSWEWGKFFIEKIIKKHRYVEKGKLYKFKTLYLMKNGFQGDNFNHPNIIHSDISINKISQVISEQIPSDIDDINVYFTRKGKGSRAIKNEKDIEKAMSDMGFLVYDSDEKTIEEQLQIFRSANNIIALHGAGLSNLIACKEGTKVIEIFTKKGTQAYKQISEKLNLNYQKINITLDNDNSIKKEDIDKISKLTFNKKSNTLVKYANRLNEKINTFEKIISEKDIDTIKETAISIEKNDIKGALKLMKIAQKLRPKGPLINKKVIEYSKAPSQGRKKIFFHVGFHKTGTTSIQKWLDEHFNTLSQDIHIYNLTDGSTGPLKNSANQFDLSGFTPENLNRFNKACLSLERQIRNLKQRKILFTDEQIFGIPLGFSNNNFIQNSPYPNASKIFNLLCHNFTDYDLEFIICERNHEDWLRSIWNQMNKQKSTNLDYDEFIETVDNKKSTNEIASEIQKEAKNHNHVKVKKLNFEKEMSFENIWEMDFFQTLKVPKEIQKNCNPSLKKLNQSIRKM